MPLAFICHFNLRCKKQPQMFLLVNQLLTCFPHPSQQEELCSDSVERIVVNPNAAYDKFKDKRVGTKGLGEYSDCWMFNSDFLNDNACVSMPRSHCHDLFIYRFLGPH